MHYFHFTGDIGQGAVYLFNLTGHLMHKFTTSDGKARDKLGYAVPSFGKVLVIGAPMGSKANVRTGAAYIFDLDSRAHMRKLTATDGAVGDSFGHGVTIHENIIMVSAFPSWQWRCVHL